ncbi:hypothetical protein BJ085DRAFT_40466 [Dimargaris cristalligena]|uniref:MIT domain-containing protein n=1 Tax=Dimargaris cristalligena TaxID=215637 RepID=A0A4P9ZLH0_9FUNG|nr:hypothetical protein BJ085DRAFT_40466 [Dimargaris cristalligena]|eukprot:RKP33331.1 hypothetical protein BJ085DRAFT_40466 [Dimargaris cristalligena]
MSLGINFLLGSSAWTAEANDLTTYIPPEPTAPSVVSLLLLPSSRPLLFWATVTALFAASIYSFYPLLRRPPSRPPNPPTPITPTHSDSATIPPPSSSSSSASLAKAITPQSPTAGSPSTLQRPQAKKLQINTSPCALTVALSQALDSLRSSEYFPPPASAELVLSPTMFSTRRPTPVTPARSAPAASASPTPNDPAPPSTSDPLLRFSHYHDLAYKVVERALAMERKKALPQAYRYYTSGLQEVTNALSVELPDAIK